MSAATNKQTQGCYEPSVRLCVCPTHSVGIRVAPDLAVDPGPGHNPLVLVIQPLGPVATVDGRQQAAAGVADVDLGVLAAG